MTCRLSRKHTPSDGAESGTLRKPCRCEQCIALCNPGNATDTACSAGRFWHPASCRPGRCRSGCSTGYLPIAVSRKTQRLPVRQSKPVESLQRSRILKDCVCLFSCSYFILSAILVSSKKLLISEKSCGHTSGVLRWNWYGRRGLHPHGVCSFP